MNTSGYLRVLARDNYTDEEASILFFLIKRLLISQNGCGFGDTK